VSEGVFLYGTLWILMKKRWPGGAAHGVMCAWSVLFLLLDGEVQPTALVSGALSVLVLCGLSERYGAAAAVGFLFSRSWLEQAVFGFAGAAGALYETYPVNLYWLNGGNAGLQCGALMIVTLAGLAMWLYRERLLSLLKKAKRT